MSLCAKKGGEVRKPPQPSGFTKSSVAPLVVTGTVIGAGAHPASAQDATGAGGIQYFVMPYLWLAGTYATTTTPLGDVGADRDRLHIAKETNRPDADPPAMCSFRAGRQR